MEIPLARRFPTENQIFAPINALEEESAIVAQNARQLEHQLDTVLAASPYHLNYIENAETFFYDRGHSAIRAAAYLGWKTAEQSTHVVQAAGGVLGCAIMMRMIIALRRNEHVGTGLADFTLRPWFARGWQAASRKDDRCETEDERRTGVEDEKEIAEDDEDESIFETLCTSEAEDEVACERSRVPNAVWWATLEGFDWWSVRTAQSKARSHIAHALAKGLVAFRAIYEPLEEVTIANWDLREILHMFEHPTEPLWLCTEQDADAARQLAAAAGEACGAVRRLLREVRRIVALMHVALLSLASGDERRRVLNLSPRADKIKTE